MYLSYSHAQIGLSNYVVQKVLDIADPGQVTRIMERIRAQSSELKRFTYGKHILSRYEKMSAAPWHSQQQR